MNNKKVFYDVLEKTNAVALATSVNNLPNVRIVNFCFDTSRPGVLYFTSHRDSQKVVEFQNNNKVTFTTVPSDGESIAHIRTKSATVQKGHYSINDVEALFVEKIPGYNEIIAVMGEKIDVFEIHIKEAIIIMDNRSVLTVKF